MEHEAWLICTCTLYYNIRIEALIIIWAFINKNTFKGGCLFERRRLLEVGR